jgi:hypothetical protein
MSETETETYLAEIETAEAEAAGLLADVGADGLDQRARATIKHLRMALKRHRDAVDVIRQEAATSARQELIRERQAEANFRRLGVPPSARGLFGDLDPTDSQAMQARATELRAAGVSWPGMPQPAGPPPPDPALVAQQAMQRASSGAVTLSSAGDLKARMLDMKANPGRYSDEQIQSAVNEYNQAVTRAAMPSSGALG